MLFTSKNNKGIANELDFVSLFDKKLVKELDSNSRELLYSLFNQLDENDHIECWKSKFYEKADIKIRIKDDIKGISIKMGERNSVHQEHVDDFCTYLLNIGVSQDIVNKFQNYIKGIINGEAVDTLNYKKEKQEEIIEIKNALADLYVKVNLIIRFLFKGKENQPYDADAIIHGTKDQYLWATKSEILDYLIKYPDGKTVNVKVGPLFIQCRNRNLKCNDKSINAQKYIQAKWYNLEKDLYYIRERRKRKLLKCINK